MKRFYKKLKKRAKSLTHHSFYRKVQKDRKAFDVRSCFASKFFPRHMTESLEERNHAEASLDFGKCL